MRIAPRERHQQLELTVACEYDRERSPHPGIGLVAATEIADSLGGAQRERPDRPHALLGAAMLEQLAQVALGEPPHLFERLRHLPSVAAVQ